MKTLERCHGDGFRDKRIRRLHLSIHMNITETYNSRRNGVQNQRNQKGTPSFPAPVVSEMLEFIRIGIESHIPIPRYEVA